MTDFDKIKSYYHTFNEWERLISSEGKLEYDLCFPLITKYLNPNSTILDLGGGPGRYTIALAKAGYTMHLADLSPTLLEQAKIKIHESGIKHVRSITQLNATDLSAYSDSIFDAVLLFGPLYHLTTEEERLACLNEVHRVLKTDGLVFASFIPYMSGAIGVAERLFRAPNQVSVQTLNQVFEQGIFNNNASEGFQEGYYPSSDEVIRLFQRTGFSNLLLRSIRGWGSGREEEIYHLKEKDPEMFEAVINLINKTAAYPSVIEMCSHALFIGSKK